MVLKNQPSQHSLKEKRVDTASKGTFFGKIRQLGIKTKLAILGVLMTAGLTTAEIKNAFLTKKIVNYELNKKQEALHDVIDRDEDFGPWDYMMNSDLMDKQKKEAIDEIFNELSKQIDNAKTREEVEQIIEEFKNKKESWFDKFVKDAVLTDDEKKGIEEVLNDKDFILKLVDYFSSKGDKEAKVLNEKDFLQTGDDNTPKDK